MAKVLTSPAVSEVTKIACRFKCPFADWGQELSTMVQEKLIQREMKGEGRLWSQAEIIIILIEGKMASKEKTAAKRKFGKGPRRIRESVRQHRRGKEYSPSNWGIVH